MQVSLYRENSVIEIDFTTLKNYIENRIKGWKVIISDIGVECQNIESMALAFASARVKYPNKDFIAYSPLYGEIDYEKRRLGSVLLKSAGIIYDGYEVQHIYKNSIPETRKPRYINIIFTDQLIGTYDTDDLRYHARVAVYGHPSIISVTGVVEAPAKPREYYLMKQRLAMEGRDNSVEIAGLKNDFKGKFIDYNDPNMTEVIKGYVMQSIFYHIYGNPFCYDPDCRLFNAHWQEELIRSQLNGRYEFCDKHERELNKI